MGDFLKENGLTSNVNFWTPTDWKISGLKKGARLYFMLKSPIRKIGGYGTFIEYKTMSVYDAWDKFGIRNGCDSLLELERRLTEYKSKVTLSTIGCIVLEDLCFYRPSKCWGHFPKGSSKTQVLQLYNRSFLEL